MKGSFKSTQMVSNGQNWCVAIENKQTDRNCSKKTNFQSKFKICALLVTKLTVFVNSTLFSIKN